MTSFVAWIGVDARGPASIYFASDSRISWSYQNKTYGIWDHGRKLFASAKYPEIFGYFGDTFFPSQVLAQVLDLIDGDILFESSDNPEIKFGKVISIVRRSFKDYPLNQGTPFTLIYSTRENSKMESCFHTAILSWSQEKGWTNRWLSIPKKSDVILSGGSGRQSINHWYERWSKTKEKGTTRSIFGSFCDSLQSGEDKYSGGAPQLVGIYRIGAAKTFGIIYQDKRYLLGLNIDKSENLDFIQWRNNLFERCDWRNKKLLKGAQQHKRPAKL